MLRSRVESPRRAGFTLIELLMVISIVALLAALLFPVFVQAKKSGQRVPCVSNLRSVGMGISLYAADADDRYPWGGDAKDLHTTTWQYRPKWDAMARTMPPIQDALLPYTRSRESWRCPLDAGMTTLQDGAGTAIDGKPSLWSKFGISYFYRTDLAFRGVTHPAQTVLPSGIEYGPAEVTVAYDASSLWHGDRDAKLYRYNAIMADGHIESQDERAFIRGLVGPPESP